jgi:uncharacterized protein (DUF58 family)
MMGGAGERLIAPATLARLANLELLARTVVEGTLAGLHRSPRLGISQEFAEYRAYVPGDDLRFVDWSVYGRTDRTYVKRFFGDTNARLMLLVDASASMGIPPAPGAVSKLDYARFTAAALACLAARQHDAVGLVTFDETVREHRPASARPLARAALYHRLEALTAAGATDLPGALAHAAQRLHKRSLLVLISDLFCEPDPLARPLRALAAHGHELLLIHLLDPAERQIPRGPTTLRDVETGAVMDVAEAELAEHYPRRLARHLTALERLVRGIGGDYLRMETDRPLDLALARYLRFRSRQP